MVSINNVAGLDELLQNWTDSPRQTKQAFLNLKNHLSKHSELKLDFNARPGVTFSLRARHDHQHHRPLFVMIDIIDDDPSDRWLSVCFYGEMITDPDEIGDFVPEGLLGEDAHCFDIDGWDEERLQYVIERLDEAYSRAAALKEAC